jgi:nucleotide-binding universal stress UspA family protein
MSSDTVVAFQRSDHRFDTLLVPTDGSALSMAAALKAVALARRLRSQVIVLSSIPAYQYPVYVGGIPFEYPNESEYEAQCRAIAERYIALLARAAQAQDVAVRTCIEFNGSPAQSIIEVAKRENCGMIFMGSHGRGGLSAVFLGSVALKTLTLSPMPVVVDHPSSREIADAQDLMNQNGIEP